jgi:hypothetical protein
MPAGNDNQWCPFRPTVADLEAIGEDVAEIPEIQRKTLARNKYLRFPDRVAHEYQIAGGKVIFKVADEIPAPLAGIGLFQTGAEYTGIGRISTGLGTPHVETNPDFLGIMTAFQTSDGQRVDFLGINNPASPTDNHRDFISVLHATGESAGVDVPLFDGSSLGNLLNLAAEDTVFGAALVQRMGPRGALTLGHITKQTVPTSFSSTAYQTYWTGIVEAGGTAGKFTIVPVRDENHNPGLNPGERHLSGEWRKRQAAGDIEFGLYWIAFLSEDRTPTVALTHPWEQDHKQLAGEIVFPRIDPDSDDAGLWASLASEMGANPGNWVADQANDIKEPATVFGNARKIAYHESQLGRDALPPETYQTVFKTGRIGPELAEELKRRREVKAKAGHVNRAP